MIRRVPWPLLVRLFLGVVFLVASLDKIVHPADFAKVIHNYQILPDGLINLAAICLPWFEVVLGLCLISGRWLAGAVVWTNLVVGLFLAALIFNLTRGLNVHCGCFSTQGGGPADWWTVARDLGFLAAAGYLAWVKPWRVAPIPEQDQAPPD